MGMEAEGASLAAAAADPIEVDDGVQIAGGGHAPVHPFVPIFPPGISSSPENGHIFFCFFLAPLGFL